MLPAVGVALGDRSAPAESGGTFAVKARDRVDDAEAVLVVSTRRTLVRGGRGQAMDHFGRGEVRKPRPYESRYPRNDRRRRAGAAADAISAVIKRRYDVGRRGGQSDLQVPVTLMAA